MMTEEEGIKAIIALQGLAGITETEEQARAGWNAMNDNEKDQTELFYNTLCGNKEN